MRYPTETNKTIFIKLMLIFCLILWSNKQHAQNIDPTYISISEGLASPVVNAVLQDSYGLIWIGTEHGLQNYDGIRFETFKNISGKPTSLLNNLVWGITEDADHNIWVANDQGISKYNRLKRTFTNYNIAQLLNLPEGSGIVFNIHTDSQKRLWAATIATEILLYNPKTDTWDEVKYELADPSEEINKNGHVFGFTEDSNGGIWIGSNKYGLLFLGRNDTAFKQVPVNPTNFIGIKEELNHITYLYADTANIIWMTTRSGVYKYDPTNGVLKTIIEYQENQNDPWNHWNSILTDPKGNIWIANNYRGVLKFDGISDNFMEMSITGSFKLKNIGWNITLTDFMVDKTGIFWIGNRSQGLMKFDPEKKPFLHYTHDDNNPLSLSMNGVFGLTASRVNPNLIYVGTRGTGLNIFDQQKQTFRKVSYTAKNDVYGGAVRSIGENDNGTLWLGTWGDGLIELDNNYKEIRRYTYDATKKTSISDDKVRVIKKDIKGNFWIGTNNGLNYFQPETGEFRRIYGKQSSSYAEELIRRTEDLAASNNKVAGINNVTDFQNLSEAFEVKEDGKFLVFNVGEGDNGSMVDFGWIENMQKDMLWSAKDYYKSYYAGGASKNRMNIEQINLPAGKYQLRYQSDDSHSYGKWNELPPDQTSFYGIVLIKISNGIQETLNSLFNQNNEMNEISGSNISAIAIAGQHLWVGTNPDGLNRIDLKTNEVKIYKHDPANKNSLSSNAIFDVYEDGKGIVWITTDAGINRFDPKNEQFKIFTEEDGLPTNLTESILPGDNGEMWISTQSGLSQMVTSESLGKVTFINYNAEDGLGGDTFLAQTAGRSVDGRIYFGGDHGLNAVSKITANKIAPDLLLSNLLISNQSVYDMGEKSPLTGDLLDLEEISLTHDQNNLSFEFAALHYANPQKNQYAHMLKGYDKDWVYDNRNYASYTNLDPGTYEFMIRASNAYGVWNEEGKSIKIIISPPWWRTWWAYSLYGILLILGIFGFDRFQRKRLLEKEHRLAKEKELEHAREIEKAYNDLKATQSQLIQSEKMASLGELTAGIAHEIQNPLNFVNNFAEVSNELMEEMKEEFTKGAFEEGFSIAEDIRKNLEKITYHGKRADKIVKGMLQHSRTSSGQKELTDINALADEYLRLAYHGLRAKDKSFNSKMETDFDPTLPKIELVPQDIGRVILNLITNAFYVVNEKSKQGIAGYEPTVSVTTRKDGNKVLVSVKDNGNGITEHIKEKIFQPFFTTKPTGQGTGLGLSLSYDIVKAHGGEIKVTTKENVGTEFTIVLPS